MISFFIPIKKNSKRVKNKSTRRIGKFKLGLTEIKILHLKKLKNILKKDNRLPKMEFIISTDCEKVKKYVKKYPWLKLHNRTRALATDDCLDKLIKEVPKICLGKFILWTHVTSPCFNEFCYKNFLLEFLKNIKKCDSAFSANLVGTFVLNDKYKWISHDITKKKWPRTQDLKKLFSVNSAAFIAKRSIYTKMNDRLGKKPFPIISEKWSGFDIDNMEDFDFYQRKLI